MIHMSRPRPGEYSADLQRHDLVRESDEQRGGEQQQHDRAVHGGQSLYTWSDTMWLFRPMSCARMTIAMIPAIRKNPNDVIRYR
jgi:hypothetical protein